MLKNIILLLLVTLTVSACRSKQLVTSRTEVGEVIVERFDTTITTPSNEISILKPLETLLEPLIIENTSQTLTLQYYPVSGTIKAISEVKEQDHVIQGTKTTNRTTKEEVKNNKVDSHVEEVNSGLKLLIVLFLIVMGFIVLLRRT